MPLFLRRLSRWNGIVACWLCVLFVSAPEILASEKSLEWKAGAASTVITPEDPMWMAGYAARDKPSEGKVQDLFAKALAVEDNRNNRLVIVTTDLIGIPRELREVVQLEVQKEYELPPESLLLNASHTHCGPELRTGKGAIYGLSADRISQSRQYLEKLQEQILSLVGEALEDLAPARLSYSHARAGFSMNRRLKTERGVRNSPNPDGPVDQNVPVLRVHDEEENLKAVLFGYACHNATLSFYQFCGDYAGYAQEYVEEAHPGTTALFLTGCGGDQNPYPRRTLELARQHGRALANGVETALEVRLPREIEGPLGVALEEVTLKFATPPSREELLKLKESNNKYDRRHAKLLLEELNRTGEIRDEYPYLIQVVQFGDDLTLVALAGEVVVDYSLRLKKELAGPEVWVAGYTNDVFGYVPSLRVLKEGGYEGGGAMRYTDLPGPFAPSVEKRIVEKVHELANRLNGANAEKKKDD